MLKTRVAVLGTRFPAKGPIEARRQWMTFWREIRE